MRNFFEGLLERAMFSSRRRHTRYWRDWSSDVCSSDLYADLEAGISGSMSSALLPEKIAPVIDQIGRASCRERV